jgi:hypothetical protein
VPALTYSASGFPFTAFTKILSADVNTCFTDIRTLLNTTGLDDTNLAAAGITRATKLKTGTADYVLINSGTGTMSEEAQLNLTRGGTGASLSLSGAAAGWNVQVNSGVTGLTLAAPASPDPMKVFNFYRFG